MSINAKKIFNSGSTGTTNNRGNSIAGEISNIIENRLSPRNKCRTNLFFFFKKGKKIKIIIMVSSEIQR